jgi:hypothetical protein
MFVHCFHIVNANRGTIGEMIRETILDTLRSLQSGAREPTTRQAHFILKPWKKKDDGKTIGDR